MADYSGWIEVRGNFKVMTPDDVFNWGVKVVGIDSGCEFAKFALFEGAGDFASLGGVGCAKDDCHDFFRI